MPLQTKRLVLTALAGLNIIVLGVAGFAVASPNTVVALAEAARVPHLLFVLRMVHSRYSQCTAWEAVRAANVGVNPVNPAIAAAIHIIAKDQAFHLAETPEGRFWIPARDLHTLGQMLTEQHSSSVYDVAGVGIRTGDTVIDCGANVGVFTRKALRSGARKVIAIDPAPEAVECLRRNFADEIKDGRVIVVPEGVWNEPGVVDFLIDSQSWGDRVDFSHAPGTHTIKVTLTTIDAITSRLGLDRVDFIKIDIEGAEKQALLGAKATVAKFRPRMAIALEHLKNDVADVPAQVRTLWPGMRTIYGPCALEVPSGISRVQPQVVMAY
jgi:FkbM family methyltransferase